MKRSARVRFEQPDLPTFYVEGEGYARVLRQKGVYARGDVYASVAISSPRTNEQGIGRDREIVRVTELSARTGRYVSRFRVQQKRYGSQTKTFASLGDALLDSLHDEIALEADRVRLEAARIIARRS